MHVYLSMVEKNFHSFKSFIIQPSPSGLFGILITLVTGLNEGHLCQTGGGEEVNRP